MRRRGEGEDEGVGEGEGGGWRSGCNGKKGRRRKWRRGEEKGRMRGRGGWMQWEEW